MKGNRNLSIFGWLIGGLFLLGGSSLLVSNPLEGFIDILAGLSVFPLVWKVAAKKFGFHLSGKFQAVICVVLLFISGAVHGQTQTNTKALDKEHVVQQTRNIPTVAQPIYHYSVLLHDTIGALENYFILIDPKDDPSGEAIARIVKKECQNKCNITLYDDQSAYTLDKSILDNPELETTSWDQQHYVFLADHTIGYMEFEGDTYSSYPDRDSTYQTLKSGQKLPTPKPTLSPLQAVIAFEKDAENVTVVDIYKSPNSYKGKAVVFNCSVSGFPKNDNGDVGGINCNDTSNYGSNVQIAIDSSVDVTKINNGDTLKVDGTGLGAIQGKNSFGADVTTGGIMGIYLKDLTTGYKSY